ncbi:MAG: endonuclease/exonuclease/phosphatase family protein [Sandaracinaceae bacterium]|nr:endonuclease/exonuclease/phosphatase family protein [Sandaracinaceae bacterium]
MRVAPLALLALGCGEAAASTAGVTRGAPSDRALWVLTYNVNFERPDDATVAAIEEADADLVFLEETHERWEASIRARLGARYPHVTFRHAPAEGGLAILSRYPFAEVRHGLAEGGAFPSWRVTVATPLGALDVLLVHLHPPLDEDGRLVTGYFTTSERRLRELRAHLGARAPDLVLGDFNEGEGPALEHLAALGLRDAQRAWPPVEDTWSWDVGATELVGCPDHVFVGPALAITAVQVMPRGGSDHRPLRVALERAR